MPSLIVMAVVVPSLIVMAVVVRLPIDVVMRQPVLTTVVTVLGFAGKVVLLIALALVWRAVALATGVVVAAAHGLLASVRLAVVPSA
jgi:hypothetical protein